MTAYEFSIFQLAAADVLRPIIHAFIFWHVAISLAAAVLNAGLWALKHLKL